MKNKNKKKKIEFISIETSADNGGIQNVAYLLSEEFNKDGTVENFSFNTRSKEKSESTKYYKAYFSNKLLVKLILAMKIIKNKFTFMKVSYLLNHWELGIVFAILNKILNVDYSIMCHGNEIYPYNKSDLDKISVKAKQFIRKYTLTNARNIYTCSEFTKQMVFNITKHNNVEVINPPVKQNNVQENDVTFDYFLFIGRLVKRKGVDKILSSFNEFTRKGYKSKLLIAGDGPEMINLKKQTYELNLENVEFLGNVSESIKYNLLKGCMAMIMPSVELESENSVEGFGITYLEANTFGKLAVGTSTGGVSDAIKNDVTGYLINETSDKLTDVLIKIHTKSKSPANGLLEHFIDCKAWSIKFSPELIALKYLESMKK